MRHRARDQGLPQAGLGALLGQFERGRHAETSLHSPARAGLLCHMRSGPTATYVTYTCKTTLKRSQTSRNCSIGGAPAFANLPLGAAPRDRRRDVAVRAYLLAWAAGWPRRRRVGLLAHATTLTARRARLSPRPRCRCAPRSRSPTLSRRRARALLPRRRAARLGAALRGVVRALTARPGARQLPSQAHEEEAIRARGRRQRQRGDGRCRRCGCRHSPTHRCCRSALLRCRRARGAVLRRPTPLIDKGWLL